MMGTSGTVGQKLDLLEQELKCVICLSVFDNPHSLPCNHHFCYACIAEFFRVKSQCPLCKLPTIKRAIIKNQILANVIIAYHNLKEVMSTTQPKVLPSPSPKKRQVNTPSEGTNKRTRRSLTLTDNTKADTKSVPPPGCIDFSVVLDFPSRKPADPPTTHEVATQTTSPVPSDPPIDTNQPPSNLPNTQNETKNKKTSRGGEGDDNSDPDDPYHFPSSPQTRANTPSSLPSSRSPRIDSLKKTKPVTPSIPSSSRHTPSPYKSPSKNTNHTSPSNYNTTSNHLPKASSSSSTTTTTTTSSTLGHTQISPSSNNKSPQNHKSTTPPLVSPSISPPQSGSSKRDNLQTPTKFGTNSDESTNENQPAKTANSIIKSGKGATVTPKSRGKSKCNKVVILPTSIDTQAIATAKAILKELGGSMVSKYSPEVTHVIAGLTGAFCARRTIKYCLGVTQGKWVVPMDWLTQSQAAKHWVAEEPFEVEGDSVTKGGPKTAREAVENEADPLFTNCQIYLLGTFDSPSKAEFKRLLQLGGAEVSAKTPTKKHPAKTRRQSNSHIEAIVCNPMSFSTLEREEVERLKGLGRPVVDTRWILDCVSYYQVLPLTEYEFKE